mmetsp:Transcript_39261/g.104027  ORF Transcript_39261/g.104027 Transcript_39261/m.104027 type:complete len:272 (-) Transcript_39261:6148-6963(-)
MGDEHAEPPMPRLGELAPATRSAAAGKLSASITDDIRRSRGNPHRESVLDERLIGRMCSGCGMQLMRRRLLLTRIAWLLEPIECCAVSPRPLENSCAGAGRMFPAAPDLIGAPRVLAPGGSVTAVCVAEANARSTTSWMAETSSRISALMARSWRESKGGSVGSAAARRAMADRLLSDPRDGSSPSEMGGWSHSLAPCRCRMPFTVSCTDRSRHMSATSWGHTAEPPLSWPGPISPPPARNSQTMRSEVGDGRSSRLSTPLGCAKKLPVNG